LFQWEGNKVTIERKCGHCGHAILAAHAGRKYCSPECYRAVRRGHELRKHALRYAPPKPLASRGEFEKGQTVRVPSIERRKIGGAMKSVAVTEYATVRKVTAKFVYVSVGNTTRRCTRAQLMASQPKELEARFGYGAAVGVDAV
jgi:ribosomal protein S27AE